MSTFGWQAQLSTFNVVPRNALVFDYVQDGNLSGIRTLFAQGLASPMDVDPDGHTLLVVCTVIRPLTHAYSNAPLLNNGQQYAFHTGNVHIMHDLINQANYLQFFPNLE